MPHFPESCFSLPAPARPSTPRPSAPAGKSTAAREAAGTAAAARPDGHAADLGDALGLQIFPRLEIPGHAGDRDPGDRVEQGIGADDEQGGMAAEDRHRKHRPERDQEDIHEPAHPARGDEADEGEQADDAEYEQADEDA